MHKRYIVKWNKFANQDRGGSTPMSREFNKLKNAKQHAINVSNDYMVPGLVEVYDTYNGRNAIAYQHGQVNKPL